MCGWLLLQMRCVIIRINNNTTEHNCEEHGMDSTTHSNVTVLFVVVFFRSENRMDFSGSFMDNLVSSRCVSRRLMDYL